MLDYRPAARVMVDKLYEQYQRGYLEDGTWDCKFMLDIRERLKINGNLSEKQIKNSKKYLKETNHANGMLQ